LRRGCAGDFIDDYAVDPVECNDQSFMFTVDVEGGRLRRVLLQPTIIEDCQARLALRRRGRQGISISPVPPSHRSGLLSCAQR
jgi:poly-gamma-glutamate synthesis protein (capsule biosynthesis protein)